MLAINHSHSYKPYIFAGAALGIFLLVIMAIRFHPANLDQIFPAHHANDNSSSTAGKTSSDQSDNGNNNSGSATASTGSGTSGGNTTASTASTPGQLSTVYKGGSGATSSQPFTNGSNTQPVIYGGSSGAPATTTEPDGDEVPAAQPQPVSQGSGSPTVSVGLPILPLSVGL